MEIPIPSALQFTHQQRYVRLTPGSVKKITIIQASPRKEGVITGSTARRVVRRIQIPVFIVPRKEDN